MNSKRQCDLFDHTASYIKLRYGACAKVLNLFPLHKGFIFLSVNECQSFIGVFNGTFAGFFFFIYNNYETKGLSTER